jgi:hypothetical protein
MTATDKFLRIVFFLIVAMIIVYVGLMMEFFLLYLATITCGIYLYFNRPYSGLSSLGKLVIISLAVSWIIALGQLAKEAYAYFF